MQAMYETVVESVGGRDGTVKSSDGMIDMKIAMPKGLGGKGGATNPEQLFAAGYAACFHSALQMVAGQHKQPLNKSTVSAKVTLGKADSGSFELAVVLSVGAPGVEKAALHKLVEAAHKVCPYSAATRGNIDVKLELV